MPAEPPSPWELLRGRDPAPPQLIGLAAGALTVGREGADLRYVRWGAEEVVRRLYVAVRDENWDTVPARYGEPETTTGDDGFQVIFDAHHQAGGLDFSWRGQIAGAGATLTYQLDGLAHSAFPFQRIGLCVLHPPSAAGRQYHAETAEGPITGHLPDLIAPQRLKGGFLRPLFPSYRELWIQQPPGYWLHFRFEGDLFEMEDQRNWTDASFKTYSTPLALGGPHQASPGRRIRQQVTVEVVPA